MIRQRDVDELVKVPFREKKRKNGTEGEKKKRNGTERGNKNKKKKIINKKTAADVCYNYRYAVYSSCDKVFAKKITEKTVTKRLTI